MNTSYESEFLSWYRTQFTANNAAPDKVEFVRKRLWDAWVNCRVLRVSPHETASTFDAIVNAMRMVGYVPISKGHPGSPTPPEGGSPVAACLNRKAA